MQTEDLESIMQRILAAGAKADEPHPAAEQFAPCGRPASKECPASELRQTLAA
jgi:hypothetical protein